jgi:hypothetical protein
MGLFSRAANAEQSVRPTRTIDGKPLAVPEEIGAIPRRVRLMAAAVLRVRSLPLAHPAARGFPLGDCHGMEEIVAAIRPVFSTERSLVRWVAIRGALLFLDMTVNVEVTWGDLLAAMGLRIVPGPASDEERTELLRTSEQVSPEVERDIIGVFGSLAVHLEDYERVSNMPIDQVNADPFWRAVNEAVGLDYIAWTAVALSRTNAVDVALRMPEAGLLEHPGWYADPLWAKAERYWDGTDWTARVRVKDGRRWVERSQSLS